MLPRQAPLKNYIKCVRYV